MKGKELDEMKLYRDNKDRISGEIRIARQTGDTFGKDIEKMLNLKLTFDQAIASDQFRIMSRKRLKMVKEKCLHKWIMFSLGLITVKKMLEQFKRPEGP